MATNDLQRMIRAALDRAVVEARKQADRVQGHTLHPFAVRYEYAHASTACRKCGRMVEIDVRAMDGRTRDLIGGTALFRACGSPLLSDESATGSRVAPTARGSTVAELDSYSRHVDRLVSTLPPHELETVRAVVELERESWEELQPPERTARFRP